MRRTIVPAIGLVLRLARCSEFHYLAGGLFRRRFRFLLLLLGHSYSSIFFPLTPARAGIQRVIRSMSPIYFLRSALCGLRLPMRPLSLPAAGSITALMRVGLPESIAAFTARFNSSGLVALTPTPSNASIILS